MTVSSTPILGAFFVASIAFIVLCVPPQTPVSSSSSSSRRSSSGGVDAWSLGGTHCDSPCVPGNERIMRQKQHGTSATAVQGNLRWHVEFKLADRICNFNRQYAERMDYWRLTSSFALDEHNGGTVENPVHFYDSNTGLLVFTVPVAQGSDGNEPRSWTDFVDESTLHGWPSFRNAEVNWDNVRVLPNGETVSTAGTHLGHNLPDAATRAAGANRYCINLVSIAGRPITGSSTGRSSNAPPQPMTKTTATTTTSRSNNQ